MKSQILHWTTSASVKFRDLIKIMSQIFHWTISASVASVKFRDLIKMKSQILHWTTSASVKFRDLLVIIIESQILPWTTSASVALVKVRDLIKIKSQILHWTTSAFHCSQNHPTNLGTDYLGWDAASWNVRQTNACRNIKDSPTWNKTKRFFFLKKSTYREHQARSK
jgi:hypothetical protein